jgi:hypothetical protein
MTTSPTTTDPAGTSPPRPVGDRGRAGHRGKEAIRGVSPPRQGSREQPLTAEFTRVPAFTVGATLIVIGLLSVFDIT